MSSRWIEQRLSHWFVTGWAEQFTTMLRASDPEGKLADVTLSPSDPHPDAWAAWHDPVWCSVKAEAADGAELLVGCARDTINGLTPGIVEADGEAPDAGGEAHQQLIHRTLSALGSTVEAKTGRKVAFGSVAKADPPKDTTLGVEYQVNLGGVVHLLALVPSTGLIDAVLTTPAASKEDLAGDTLSDARQESADGPPSQDPEPGPAVPRNLDVLLDVDLDLSVSFGRTELLLADVLKLASGSIVELNRSANDPVDVLVNNSIVARGEVVVVDGNYGIRITEVVSQRERIRSVM